MRDMTAAMSRAINRVYAADGLAATYTDRNGAHTPCTVLVERDLSRYGEVAQVNAKTAALSVRVSEVAAAPRRTERFTLTVAGTVYTVDSLQSTTDLEHKVFVA